MDKEVLGWTLGYCPCSVLRRWGTLSSCTRRVTESVRPLLLLLTLGCLWRHLFDGFGTKKRASAAVNRIGKIMRYSRTDLREKEIIAKWHSHTWSFLCHEMPDSVGNGKGYPQKTSQLFLWLSKNKKYFPLICLRSDYSRHIGNLSTISGAIARTILSLARYVKVMAQIKHFFR